MTPAPMRGADERPLAIDLFCGLFGWSAGLVAEGWRVVGIDLEDMHENFGMARPREFGLIIQDVLTVDGRAFSGVDLIVASPPCQEFSWLAMPWSRGKQVGRALRGADCFPVNYRGSRTIEDLTRLFNYCFRIQAEASAAAGRHIPLVIENVRGAIPWVGRSRWNFGSYHLWGDVPALMPATLKTAKVSGIDWQNYGKSDYVAKAFTATAEQRLRDEDGRKLAGFRFDGSGRSFQSASVEHTGIKAPGMNWSDRTRERLSFTDIAGRHAAEGREGAGTGAEWFDENLCRLPSASPRRKAASAMIAKIPLPLARWIARCFLPRSEAA